MRRAPADAKEKAKDNAEDATPAGEAGEEKAETKAHPNVLEPRRKEPQAHRRSIWSGSPASPRSQSRIIALPLPAKNVSTCWRAGKPGVFYYPGRRAPAGSADRRHASPAMTPR